MCVNVDALAFGHDQQVVQVFQIVTADENGLARLGSQRNFRGLGVAVGAGVARVEQFHGLQVGSTAIQNGFHPGAEVPILAVEPGGQTLVNVRVQAGIFLPEDGGVVGVGGDAFKAVQQRLHERVDVGVGV